MKRSLLNIACLCSCFGQVHVLTYHNDLARTGQNLSETILTPANVTPGLFGKLFTYPVDGYVYAQPLYVSGLTIPGRGVHNVVFAATEHDSIYAFDADGGGVLWQVSFIDKSAGVIPVPAPYTNCGILVPEIGITGTPVIDLAAATLYVVATTLEGPTPFFAHRLHALDLTTGRERPSSPVLVQATFPGAADGGAIVTFNPQEYKQRPGLALWNGVVYTAWSSHCDRGHYHGWLIGYDASTLKQVAVYNNTPNGIAGSFWASGAAPAVDADGNIYLISGNGTFDAHNGGADLGESFIKLSTRGGLPVADYFTPFNAIRLSDLDLDLGSSGALLLPDEAGGPLHPRLLVSAGKEGRIYLLDRNNMGHFQPGSDSQIVQSLEGVIQPLFGIPAYFNAALGGNTVYFSAVNDRMKAFSVKNGKLSTAPVSSTNATFGYPGSVPGISANGSTNGIVWVIDPAARLRAFDATDLSKELYDSGNTDGRDSLGTYVKFSTPAIANGKVYVGTQNSVAAFGLFATQTRIGAIVNAAGLQPGGVAPGSIVTVFGTNLATGTETASQNPLPTFLAGSELFIDGVPAPLFYASPVQLNAQIPYETPLGAAGALVKVGSNAPAAMQITIQPAVPGLFTSALGHAAALNQDGTVNGFGQAAAPGSILQVFLTGLGPMDQSVATGHAAPLNPLAKVTVPVSATIGAQDAAIMFAGLAPGLVGVLQVNVYVPLLAPGTYPLVVQASGSSSNNAAVTIGPAI